MLSVPHRILGEQKCVILLAASGDEPRPLVVTEAGHLINDG